MEDLKSEDTGKKGFIKLCLDYDNRNSDFKSFNDTKMNEYHQTERNNMKINIYGLGYVGCVSAACLSNSGFEVTGIDIDGSKVDMINRGKSPIIETELKDDIKKAVVTKKLKATTHDVGPADVSIICVGTPSSENGSLQLDYVKRVAGQIGSFLRDANNCHVVNIRSTVLPGTVEEIVIPILEENSSKKAGKDFGVCMNPEFMREGTSLHDYFNPP